MELRFVHAFDGVPSARDPSIFMHEGRSAADTQQWCVESRFVHAFCGVTHSGSPSIFMHEGPFGARKLAGCTESRFVHAFGDTRFLITRCARRAGIA